MSPTGDELRDMLDGGYVDLVVSLGPENVPKLLKLLDSQTGFVGWHAKRAIERLGGEALDELIVAYETGSRKTKTEAKSFIDSLPNPNDIGWAVRVGLKKTKEIFARLIEFKEKVDGREDAAITRTNCVEFYRAAYAVINKNRPVVELGKELDLPLPRRGNQTYRAERRAFA